MFWLDVCGGGYVLVLRKSNKGQALMEVAIVVPAMLTIFYSMWLFGTFMYTRMIVIHAANVAISEALDVASHGASFGNIQTNMEASADNILSMAVYAKDVESQAVVARNGDILDFKITTKATFGFRLPFVVRNLYDSALEYELEIQYYSPL